MTIRTGASKSRRLRILEVVHDFPPNSFAGTELYTLHLSQELQKLGHDVTVLYPVIRPESTRYAFLRGEYEGLKIVQFNRTPRPGEGISDYLNPDFDEPFRHFLKENPFDLVHFQHLLQLSSNWVHIAGEAGMKVVLKLDDMYFYCEQIHLVHGNGGYCSGPESLRKCAECRAARFPEFRHVPVDIVIAQLEKRKSVLSKTFRRVDFVHTPSRFMKSTCVEQGLENSRFEVIPTGIKPFTTMTKKAFNPENVIIAFMGAIAPRKGILDFVGGVQIFETFCRRKGLQSRLNFKVFGVNFRDEVFKYFMQKVGEFPSLNYQGKFTPSDRSSIFSQIDILAVTSLGENYPFIIREALYAGVPVISTTIAGIPEIIRDGDNGLLYHPGNLEQLATLILRIQEKPSIITALKAELSRPKTIGEEAVELGGKFGKLFSSARNPVMKPGPACSQLFQSISSNGPAGIEGLSAEECNKKGERLFGAGRLEEAASQFREAVKMNPGHSGALNNLGVVYWEQGKKMAAEKNFKAALEALPENKQALLNLIDIQDPDGLDAANLATFCSAYLENVPDDSEIAGILKGLHLRLENN